MRHEAGGNGSSDTPLESSNALVSNEVNTWKFISGHYEEQWRLARRFALLKILEGREK